MYSKIREWPWWKLYAHIRPLIKVLRVDEELKIAKDLVKELQVKNHDLEGEKERFKKEERQLENSVGEYTGMLTNDIARFSSHSSTI